VVPFNMNIDTLIKENNNHPNWKFTSVTSGNLLTRPNEL
jgi:hypothetical protein